MPPSAFHIERAARSGEGYEERLQVCRDAMAANRELTFLAHLYVRRPSLVIDRLGEDPGGRAARDQLIFVARHLADEMRAMAAGLEHLRTGPLIRLTLHGVGGAVYCDSVLADEIVLGVAGLPDDRAGCDATSPQREQVRRIDRVLTGVVDAIRDLVGQPSQNLGGFGTEATVEPVAPADDEIREVLFDGSSSAALPLCRAAVAGGFLQYVALYRSDTQLLEVDAFEGREVRRMLTKISPHTRRQHYREFGRTAEVQVAELAGLAEAATGAALLRVVFDVEQGAIFFYRVGDDRHLIGVTLSQKAVSKADDAAGSLARAFR